MPNIQVKFKDRPELNLAIDDTAVGNKFAKLIKATYSRHPTIYRDVLKYTPEYMRELSQRAKREFGWTWDEHEDINIGIAPSLHKNLETLLATGFSQITEQQDELIHELHYCLHLTQFGTGDRTSWQNGNGIRGQLTVHVSITNSQTTNSCLDSFHKHVIG